MTTRWISATRSRLPGVRGRVILIALVLVALAAAATSAANRRSGGESDPATTAPGIGARPTGDGVAGTIGAPALGLKAPEEALTHDSAPARATAEKPVASGGNAVAPLPSLDTGRAIVRTGAVDLQVRAVADAFEQVRQVATTAGGYVSDSTFSGRGDQQTAHLTLRVPADRFGDVIAQLRGLAAEVGSISTGSRDVTEETSDLEATLRNLRAVESRYIELLGRASGIGEVLQVQDRLNQVRLQIDRTEARRQLLRTQAELSTISVNLRPVLAASRTSEASGMRAEIEAAWRSSLATLERIATFALVTLVYSWWLVPPAIAGLAWWRLRRRSLAGGGRRGRIHVGRYAD